MRRRDSDSGEEEEEEEEWGERARATDSLLGTIFLDWSKGGRECKRDLVWCQFRRAAEGENKGERMGGTREIGECARERWVGERERGSESEGCVCV
jgi:hypothetical protein